MVFAKKPSLRNVEERNALVVANLALVPWAIWKMKPRLRRSVCVLGSRDACQIGRFALLRAAELWEPERGKFSTYAVICIRHAVKAHARDARILETLTQEEQEDIPQEPDQEPFLDGDFVDKAIRSLPYRLRLALKIRFGLKGCHAHSLESGAKILGVGKERFRQLLGRAVRLLEDGVWKDQLRSLVPEEFPNPGRPVMEVPAKPLEVLADAGSFWSDWYQYQLLPLQRFQTVASVPEP